MHISRFRRLAVVSAFLLCGLACCISARYLMLNPEIPYGDALGFFMLVLLPVLLAGAISSTLILRSETFSSITLNASFALLFVLMHSGWLHGVTDSNSTQWWDPNRIFGVAVLYSILLMGTIKAVGIAHKPVET